MENNKFKKDFYKNGDYQFCENYIKNLEVSERNIGSCTSYIIFEDVSFKSCKESFCRCNEYRKRV